MSSPKRWFFAAQAVTGTFLGGFLGGIGGVILGIAFSHWPDEAAGKPMALPFGVVEGCLGFVIGLVVNLVVIGVCGIVGTIAGSMLGTFLGTRSSSEESPVLAEKQDGEGRLVRGLLPVQRSGWAILAGYLGLFSLLILPAPLALLAGIVGIVDLKRRPHLHGMGRSVFGLLMGALGTGLLLYSILG